MLSMIRKGIMAIMKAYYLIVSTAISANRLTAMNSINRNRSMLGTIILVLMLATIQGSYSAATRVFYIRNTKNGFTSVTNANKKIDMIFECPIGVDDVLIYINQFSAPLNTESLKIRNCKTFTIATKCTSENRPMQLLQVSNIQHLIIQRLQYTPMVPPTVVFENISRIDVVPTQTFDQINKAFYSSGCYAQATDFRNIYFRNVTIDTVESGAFVGSNQFQNFSFVNVQIKRIQTGGIRLKHDFKGAFEMRNCVVDTVEYLGIQTSNSARVVFAENNFTEISSSGINGTMVDFYFTRNVVGTLQPHGFCLLATNIFILDNDFLHLKSEALEKLSPGLIREWGRNFGKLKFMYDFSKNSLNFLDAGSLHPDYLSYENVQTEMMVSRNKFLCSCENLGWIFSPLGHGPNSVQLEPFYDMVMDEGYGNACEKSYGRPCELPLRLMAEMIECGKCSKNVSLDDICDKFLGVTAKVTVNVNVSKETVPDDLQLDPMNYSAKASKGACADLYSEQFYILSVLVIIICFDGY